MPKFIKLSFLTLFFSLYLYADENLNTYIKNLEERLQILENKEYSQGTLKLTSSDTTMFLGGRVSLDTIYLSRANGKEGGSNSNDQFFNANNIPIETEGENSELSLTARQSKFWMKTRTKQINERPLLTLIEVDFWGSNGNERNSNSYNLRLRHAYMVYNGWTLGQTNSLFVGSSKPHTLLSPVDNVFMRQPLISYKKRFGKRSLAVSFEEPESVIMTSSGDKITVNDDRFPDFIMKYEQHSEWSDYSLSLLLRELHIDKEEKQEVSDTLLAYGMNFTAHFHTSNDNTLTFGFVGGKGIGRYMATSFFPSASITKENKIEAQLSWGTHLAYEHWFNPKIRLNIATGKVETNNVLTLGTIDKKAWSEHIGIQYNPLKKLLLGIEYIHGERILQNKKRYDVDRIYLRGSYDF